MTKPSPFKWLKTSPEIIRLTVTLYVRFPLLLRNVEDLLHERGVDISHETVRFWWHRFGPMFASEIRKRRIRGMRSKKGAEAIGVDLSESMIELARKLAQNVDFRVGDADL
jgi:putative transposase